MQELPRERLGVAIQAIGHVQGALNLTVDYVKERQAFGQSIGQFQNTRFKLAEARIELELCRALFEKCLAKFGKQEMTVDDAAMLKSPQPICSLGLSTIVYSSLVVMVIPTNTLFHACIVMHVCRLFMRVLLR